MSLVRKMRKRSKACEISKKVRQEVFERDFIEAFKEEVKE